MEFIHVSPEVQHGLKKLDFTVLIFKYIITYGRRSQD